MRPDECNENYDVYRKQYGDVYTIVRTREATYRVFFNGEILSSYKTLRDAKRQVNDHSLYRLQTTQLYPA